MQPHRMLPRRVLDVILGAAVVVALSYTGATLAHAGGAHDCRTTKKECAPQTVDPSHAYLAKLRETEARQLKTVIEVRAVAADAVGAPARYLRDLCQLIRQYTEFTRTTRKLEGQGRDLVDDRWVRSNCK